MRVGVGIKIVESSGCRSGELGLDLGLELGLGFGWG